MLFGTGLTGFTGLGEMFFWDRINRIYRIGGDVFLGQD
jgi:hypothetical protein